MKVLIALDSFKGSVSSVEGSRAIALGIQDIYPKVEIITLPLADGGEGTVDSLVHALGGELVEAEVTGPLHNKIQAVYGILGDKKTAVIEIAAACGLPLIPPENRNPSVTTTYGVGELILDAIAKGCREFIVGLGGSATNDAGVGMLQALGYSFLDQNNKEIGLGGVELQHIRKLMSTNVNLELKNCSFHVACDVNNPLYGPNGATFTFGHQKGANTEMIQELDKGLQSFAQVVLHDLSVDIHNIAGAGAAGGLGSAFAGFLQADLQSGIQEILNLVKMEEKVKCADFVITGEGNLDGQTSMGKTPLGVAQLAQKHQIPVIALAGGITQKAASLNQQGITAYFSIMNAPMQLEEALKPSTTNINLRSTTNQLFRLIRALRGDDK